MLFANMEPRKCLISAFYDAKVYSASKKKILVPNLLSVTEKFKHPCTNSITSILQSEHKAKTKICSPDEFIG